MARQVEEVTIWSALFDQAGHSVRTKYPRWRLQRLQQKRMATRPPVVGGHWENVSRPDHMMSSQCDTQHLSLTPIFEGNDVQTPVLGPSLRRKNSFAGLLVLARRCPLSRAAGVNRPSSVPYSLFVQMRLVDGSGGICTISICLANAGASDDSLSEKSVLGPLILLFHVSAD